MSTKHKWMSFQIDLNCMSKNSGSKKLCNLSFWILQLQHSVTSSQILYCINPLSCESDHSRDQSVFYASSMDGL